MSFFEAYSSIVISLLNYLIIGLNQKIIQHSLFNNCLLALNFFFTHLSSGVLLNNVFIVFYKIILPQMVTMSNPFHLFQLSLKGTTTVPMATRGTTHSCGHVEHVVCHIVFPFFWHNLYLKVDTFLSFYGSHQLPHILQDTMVLFYLFSPYS